MTLENCSKNLSHSILWEKIGQTFIFTGKFTVFFPNNCFFNNLNNHLGPEEMSYNLHKDCQKALCTPTKSSMRLPILDITGNVGQIIFFTKKVAFFSGICVLNNILGVKETIL